MQSSPLNLHQWDLEQWNGFGADFRPDQAASKCAAHGATVTDHFQNSPVTRVYPSVIAGALVGLTTLVGAGRSKPFATVAATVAAAVRPPSSVSLTAIVCQSNFCNRMFLKRQLARSHLRREDEQHAGRRPALSASVASGHASGSN